MDSTTRLMKALAAGAAANFRPNQMDRPESAKDIETAVLELKEMIQEQYSQVDVDLLDIGPGSAERQQLVARQLEEAGVAENAQILHQAQVVLDIIGAEDPSALWASDVADPPPQLK